MLRGAGGDFLETLKTGLEIERDDPSDELDDFALYPVVLLGMSYRF